MKAYLITTYHNKDTRWEYIKKELSSKVGVTPAQSIDYSWLKIHPILATNWEMYRHTSLNDKQYKQMSLTLAYYQACQTAVFEKESHFLIIEDDLKITNPSHLINQSLQAPILFDICYLAKTDHNKICARVSKTSLSPYFDKIDGNWWETPITLWSHGFALAFIAHIDAKIKEGLWLGHVDHELMKMNDTGKYKFYGAKEQLAYGLSNINQSIISKEGSISKI